MCKYSEINGVEEVKSEDKWRDRLSGFLGCQESKPGNPPTLPTLPTPTRFDYFQQLPSPVSRPPLCIVHVAESDSQDPLNKCQLSFLMRLGSLR